MKEVVSTIHIDAPVQAVFAACTDFAGAAGRISSITKMDVITPGPVGKGTKFRETRKMFGKEATETMEVLEFTPNKSYLLGAGSCGCIYRSEFLFAPSGKGTDLTVRFSARPQSFMAKLMSFIMAPLMAGMIRKCFAKDLGEIKASLENPPPAAQPAAA